LMRKTMVDGRKMVVGLRPSARTQMSRQDPVFAFKLSFICRVSGLIRKTSIEFD
jgi:hypothetical protein